MGNKYGIEVRTRRRALTLTQIQLARAIGRSQGWVGRLENLQLPASEADTRNIDAFLRERERPLPIPRSAPRRNKERGER